MDVEIRRVVALTWTSGISLPGFFFGTLNRGTKYQIYADLNLTFFVVLVFHDPQKREKVKQFTPLSKS